ncbi:MAG: efflux RND transporter periplasmic adaptor subunit [Desulfuromonadales bacterium]|nr:efflux RND transporter periplasmic adaptor subunit [Desulfuromonadales bacterium]
MKRTPAALRRNNSVVLALLLAASIWAPPAFSQPPLPVIVAPVVEATGFADRVEALGTLRADESVLITANVTETVEAIHFRDGDQVRQGDILVSLVRTEEEASLKAARALLDERRAAYERARGLVQQQALSTATLEGREALLRQTEGEVEALKARIEDRILRAPFDGLLGLREVSPGAFLRPGDPITTLDDLRRVKVDFDVPAIFLANLRPGLEIEGRVEAFPGETFRGTVSMVGTRVDPATRTVTVRAILPNPDLRLRPGLLMTIELLKNPRTALLIPEEAVLQREKTFYVFKVVDENGRLLAVQTEVRPGTRRPGQIEVVSGLQAGDRVIVHGLMQVRSGQEISIRAVEEDRQPLEQLLRQTPATGG